MNPRERIVKTAMQLFYNCGYDSTGINEILKVSRAHKQSFYQYFPSKSDLGKSYLQKQRDELINMLTQIFVKNENPSDWIETWISLLIRQAKKKVFYGCPFANFSSQTIYEQEEFQHELRKVISDILQLIAGFFDSWKAKKLISNELTNTRMAEKVLMLYEGNVQLYLITSELKYLNYLKEDLIELIS